MSLLIELEASFSERSVTLAGSGVTAYTVNAGVSLGATVATPLMSRTFDGSRALVTGAPVGAREQQIPLRVSGSTVADLQTALDALWRVCEDITLQGGGVLRYRSGSGSYVTRYRVVSAQLQVGELETYEAHVWQRVMLVLVVDPHGLPDAYAITDTFATDTLGTGGVYNLGGADWTVGAGAGVPSITGGAFVTPQSSATVYLHTGTPHEFGDVQVTSAIRFNTSAGASKSAGLVVKWIDSSNYVHLRILSNGAGGGTLAARAFIAGVDTNLGSVTVTTLTIDTSYWVRIRIEGNVVTIEWFTSEPTPMATPTHTQSATLSTAQAALFGSGIRGHVGVRWGTAADNPVTFDDFKVEPLTYRNVTFPTTLRLEGAWGGTTDALAGIYYTGSGGTAPTCMLYAWWPRVGAHNYVWNGGAEVVGTTSTVAYGWVATAVTGITTAATSVVRTTTAASIRTGSAAFEAVSTVTASSGPSFAIYRRGGFRKGVTYTFSGWIRSAADTTSMTMRLGVDGSNRANATAPVTLSTTWQQLTGTWTPANDYDVAYVAFITGTGAVTTFQFDDVMVYEGTTAPTSTLGGHGPGIIPAAAYNTAAASISGTAWTQTTDADYLVGSGPQASGALTTLGNLEFPILPHLFTPDDYTTDEVDVAVFARVEVASTQTSLACTLSIASERGTSYGARRYGSYRATGKTLTLPSSGTRFKPYYLGTITLKVDRTRPRREWLRLALTNSGAATGTVGVDYLIVVPVRSYCSTQPGSTDAITADFIASTAETTKAIGISTNGEITAHPGTAAIVEHTNSNSFTPDDGLLGEPLHIPPDGATLLVWPSDQVIDLSDSSAHSMAETYAGTVTVAMQPRVHLLKQS